MPTKSGSMRATATTSLCNTACRYPVRRTELLGIVDCERSELDQVRTDGGRPGGTTRADAFGRSRSEHEPNLLPIPAIGGTAAVHAADAGGSEHGLRSNRRHALRPAASPSSTATNDDRSEGRA